MKIFTKDTLITELRRISDLGWVESYSSGNDGGVGNTLEYLLGIEENNLPLPNAGEWEIKGQRADTSSLLTLFHMEPSPRAIHFVPKILLPFYGWPHSEAGKKYPADERSFRQTLQANTRTNRGFTVLVNHDIQRIELSFDSDYVDAVEHGEWLKEVNRRIGPAELEPQPYWGLNDLFHRMGTKLNKTVYAIAERKRENREEFFRYSNFLMLEDF